LKIINKALLAATVAISGLTAATAANAVVVVYTNEAAFTAAITGATNNTFPFTDLTDVGATYTGGAVTFTSPGNLLVGYNDGSYGTNVAYLASSGTTGIASTASGVGFFLGGYEGAQTISYSFGGTAGTFNVPSSPNTAFLGFVNTTGALTGNFTSIGELDFTRFITGNTPAAAGAVPETATWGMMLAGFGMIGSGLRSRRRSTKVSFA
jgi:hypothetical protein